MLLQLSQYFSSFSPPPPCNLPPQQPHALLPPALSSCPWVVHISSLTSLFPIPFLTSLCPFYAYQLCFLFPELPPPFFPSPSPLKTLHVMSISLILFLFQLFASFCFCFFLGSVVDSLSLLSFYCS